MRSGSLASVLVLLSCLMAVSHPLFQCSESCQLLGLQTPCFLPFQTQSSLGLRHGIFTSLPGGPKDSDSGCACIPTHWATCLVSILSGSEPWSDAWVGFPGTQCERQGAEQNRRSAEVQPTLPGARPVGRLAIHLHPPAPDSLPCGRSHMSCDSVGP